MVSCTGLMWRRTRVTLFAGFGVASLLLAGCDVWPREEKLATIHCQEVNLKEATTETYASFQRWQPGEYRVCLSLDISDGPRGPELDCDSATPYGDVGHVYDHGKTFTVRFVGDVPYDPKKDGDAEHHWRCQRMNDVNVPFICTATLPQR